MSRRPTATTRTTRQVMLHPDCHVRDRHLWHTTFTTGEFLCTRCGVKSYCPDCISSVHPLKGARLHLCGTHRVVWDAREQEQQQQRNGVQP